MTLSECYLKVANNKGFTDWLSFVFSSTAAEVDSAALEAFETYLRNPSSKTEEEALSKVNRNLITQIPEDFFFKLAKLRYYQKANKTKTFSHMEPTIKKLEKELDSFLYTNCFEYVEPGSAETQKTLF